MVVQYADGEYNSIVSQSTTLASSMPFGPSTPPAGAPEGTPAGLSPGTLMSAPQAMSSLPEGAIVKLPNGKTARKSSTGTFKDYLPGWGTVGNVVALPLDSKVTLVSVAGDPSEDEIDAIPKPFGPTAASPATIAVPKGTGPMGAKSNPDGSPLSGVVSASGDAEIIDRPFQEMIKLLNEKVQTMAASKGFTIHFDGAANPEELATWVGAGLQEKEGLVDLTLPKARNGITLIPGSVVYVGGGKGIISEVVKYPRIGDNNGAVDIVMLTGALKGKKFLEVDATDVTAEQEFLTPMDAKLTFGIQLDPAFGTYYKSGKEQLLTLATYSGPDMEQGPGVELTEYSELPNWQAAPENTKSTLDILDELRNSQKPEVAAGYYALIDGASIEDLRVRFQKVIDKDGNPRLRLTGKLTDWAGKELMKTLGAEGGPGFTGENTIQLDEYTANADGALVYSGVSSTDETDMRGKGGTWSGAVGDNLFTFFRAMLPSQEGGNSSATKVDFYEPTHSSTAPKSFHNMFDITLPLAASPADIEQALSDAGVQSSRPATAVDVKMVAENKLLSLFANLTDGKENLGGLARQQELQKIQKEWGVTGDDVELVADSNSQGQPVFLLPRAVAERIVAENNMGMLHHSITAKTSITDSPDVTMKKSLAAFVRVFSSGRLDPTVSRHISGDFIKGSSSKDDIKGIGAQYTFMYMNQYFDKNTGHVPTAQIVFDPVDVIRRLGFTANRSDGYGVKHAQTTSTFRQINTRTSTGELMIKHGLSINSSVGVAVDKKVVPLLIDALRAKGIDRIAGMSLEDYFAVDVNSLKMKMKPLKAI